MLKHVLMAVLHTTNLTSKKKKHKKGRQGIKNTEE